MPPIYVWEDFHRRIRNKQTLQDNNAMHAKPDLRVVLKWVVARSGSVIADVLWNRRTQQMNWQRIIERLHNECGIEFSPGLNQDEIASAETTWHFRFPADLKQLLMAGLPTGKRFPNWRDPSSKRIKDSLALPLDGILFDIEENGIWLDCWGSKPKSLADAKEIIKKLVDDAPNLIPIYGHRMMPDRPHDSGNPVFSIHQTDIVFYGRDLLDYLDHEFFLGAKDYSRGNAKPREIEFWDEERFQKRWKAKPTTFGDN